MALDNSTLLPINNLLDTANLDTNSPEFKTLLTSIIERVDNMLVAVNAKDIGIYNEEETLAGQNYFDNDRQVQRPVYRKVINCGTLKNAAGTTSIAHGLDNTWGYKFTRIYGTTSNVIGKIYLPIPYASATAADLIKLDVDANNINITVGKDMSAFTVTYVVIEFLEF